MNNYKKQMNIENAIQRLNWRFNNENVKVNESKIIINDNDQEAVKFLIDWVNRQKQETIFNNELFAKLYAYTLRNEIEFYKDVKFANVKLQEELKKNITYHYTNIADDLNRLELNNYYNSIGIETDHYKRMLFNQEQEDAQEKIIKEKSNDAEMIKFTKGVWNVTDVFKSLNNQITECINRYKNK